MSTFKPGTGRFAVDRFDFESHVNGSNFKHSATMITLPGTIVNGTPQNNVQDAITAIAAIVPTPLPDATASVKGVLKLTQDLGGTAALPQVTGLLGRALNVIAPTDKYVLTWDVSSTSWKPLSPFTAANDLSGDNISQSVISLTGSAGVVQVKSPIISFVSNVGPPTLQQTANAVSGDGYAFNIYSQFSSTGNGGDINLFSASRGVGGGAVKNGSISLVVQDIFASDKYLIQAADLNTRSVVSLAYNSKVSATEVPNGSNIVYIGNNTVSPTSSPVNGSILYSAGAKLFVKQGDGENFQIGSFPSIFSWSIGTNGLYKMYKASASSNTAAVTTLYTYTLAATCSSFFEVYIIGYGTNQEFQYKFSMGYGTNGASFVDVGTITTLESRTTDTLTAVPTLVRTGSSVAIKSGYSAGYSISWVTLIKVVEFAI